MSETKQRVFRILNEKGRELRAALAEKWRRKKSGDESGAGGDADGGGDAGGGGDSGGEEIELEEKPRQMRTFLQNIRVGHRDRTLSVEELLSDYVVLKPRFCLKNIAASLVYLIIPLVFDYTLFAEQIDYTAWRCLDTSSGRCSEATNGGSLYSKTAFCALDPIDSIPNELYMPTYNNGTLQDTNLTESTIAELYFVRDLHFTWLEEVSSGFAVHWSLYCENEKNNLSELIWIGVLISGIISGFVVDRFGRRATLISSAVLGSLLVLLLILVDQYDVYIVIWILQGVIYTLYTIASVIWLGETVPRRYRALTLLLFCTMVALGRFLLAILVTELENWKDITVCILFLCWLSGCCIILLPESVQFLLSHHLDSEADRALAKTSAKWNIYSKVMKLTTKVDVSHRDDDHIGALFTHRQIACRVVILMYMWAVILLPLSNTPPEDTSLELYYVIRAGVSWLFQLLVLGTMFYCNTTRLHMPVKVLLPTILMLNVICNVLTLAYTSFFLNLAIQALTEVGYLLLLLLTLELVPMPQRGCILGIGFTLRGAAAIITARFFNVDGGPGGLVIRSIIAGVLSVGAALSYQLPSIRHKEHTIPFTMGEAQERIEKRTIVIKEKQVLTGSSTQTLGADITEDDEQTDTNTLEPTDGQLADHSDSESVEPGSSSDDGCRWNENRNLKYVILDPTDPVNRYIFLDKGNRQLDIRVEQQPPPQVPPDTEPLVIVNIYRDRKLLKSYHHRSPSLIIHQSPTSSLINDVSVVESTEIGKLFGRATICGADQEIVAVSDAEQPRPLKRRNPQSSASYMDISPIIIHATRSCDSPLGITTRSCDSPLSIATVSDEPEGQFRSDGDDSNDTFEISTAAEQLSTLQRTSTQELVLEFGDTPDADSSDFGMLRKFNTHMHLEQVDVSSVGSSSSGDRWRNRMSDLEIRFHGENLDYVRYETPEGVVTSQLPVPSPQHVVTARRTLIDRSTSRSPLSEHHFSDMTTPELMRLFYDGETAAVYHNSDDETGPMFAFFPLSVNFRSPNLDELNPLQFESGSSGDGGVTEEG